MWEVNIYTWTNFKGIKKRNGAVAYVIEVLVDGTPRTREDVLALEDVTPHTAELTVLIEALKRMTKKSRLTIYTDSPYVAAGYNAGWVVGWKANDWKNVKGNEVSNRQQWEELDKLLEGHEEYVFKVGEPHSYRMWLEREVERKAKENENV